MTHSELTTHYQLPEGVRPSDCPTELTTDYRIPVSAESLTHEQAVREVAGQVCVSQYRCPACGIVLLCNDTRGTIIRTWLSTAEPPIYGAPELI